MLTVLQFLRSRNARDVRAKLEPQVHGPTGAWPMMLLLTALYLISQGINDSPQYHRFSWINVGFQATEMVV
ncbi:hypothetical protein BDZ85DRAFT_270161 [Elsinoe ampelina]|uniref:Uncharacterized protein n=1 Tax=Elsinoe ampelina TaxID=302913 RepID=A0A6A6FYL9_9PEZI|nr:hypothetical protein BDZ85DRAFT_270161 [Elsinoe ampelina]